MEIKTADEILQDRGQAFEYSHDCIVVNGAYAIKAMEEYASQFKLTPEQQKQLDAFPAILELLQESLKSIKDSYQYGDSLAPFPTRSLIDRIELAIKPYEDGI